VITDLEIGSIGTDFSRGTSWWAREDSGRARTWKSMKHINFSQMYDQTCSKIMFMVGRILNEKMMPDVTVNGPELEIVKNVSKTQISMDKCGGTRNFQTLRPPTLQFLAFVQETFGGKPLPGNFFRDFPPVVLDVQVGVKIDVGVSYVAIRKHIHICIDRQGSLAAKYKSDMSL
jgi:hypothetical protein